MKHLFFIALYILLAACGTLPETTQIPRSPVPPATLDTCQAAQHANLIGQDATALERILLMGQVRVNRPGDAVTTDFKPVRINFIIDSSNRIASIRCG